MEPLKVRQATLTATRDKTDVLVVPAPAPPSTGDPYINVILPIYQIILKKCNEQKDLIDHTRKMIEKEKLKKNKVKYNIKNRGSKIATPTEQKSLDAYNTALEKMTDIVDGRSELYESILRSWLNDYVNKHESLPNIGTRLPIKFKTNQKRSSWIKFLKDHKDFLERLGLGALTRDVPDSATNYEIKTDMASIIEYVTSTTWKSVTGESGSNVNSYCIYSPTEIISIGVCHKLLLSINDVKPRNSLIQHFDALQLLLSITQSNQQISRLTATENLMKTSSWRTPAAKVYASAALNRFNNLDNIVSVQQFVAPGVPPSLVDPAFMALIREAGQSVPSLPTRVPPEAETRASDKAAKAAEAAEADGRKDNAMPIGTRLNVAGHGMGTYVSFKRKTVGANIHTIIFDGGIQKVVKLKNEDWNVIPSEDWNVISSLGATRSVGGSNRRRRTQRKQRRRRTKHRRRTNRKKSKKTRRRKGTKIKTKSRR
jgi:hypothetical protein